MLLQNVGRTRSRHIIRFSAPDCKFVRDSARFSAQREEQTCSQRGEVPNEQHRGEVSCQAVCSSCILHAPWLGDWNAAPVIVITTASLCLGLQKHMSCQELQLLPPAR